MSWKCILWHKTCIFFKLFSHHLSFSISFGFCHYCKKRSLLMSYVVKWSLHTGVHVRNIIQHHNVYITHLYWLNSFLCASGILSLLTSILKIPMKKISVIWKDRSSANGCFSFCVCSPSWVFCNFVCEYSLITTLSKHHLKKWDANCKWRNSAFKEKHCASQHVSKG